MAAAPWIVSDDLWELVQPLLPKKERRFRYPGRRRLPERETLQGILFVLHTGISWTHLPRELGFGSGITCWRRLDEWQKAGVWVELHEVLLTRLRAAGEIEWSRAVADSSHVQAKKDFMKGASGGRSSVAAGLSTEGGPDGNAVRGDRRSQARFAGRGAGPGIRRAA
jgi:transposase